MFNVQYSMFNMIPPGTDLKYRITTTKEGFDLVRDDFAVVIKNTCGRVTHRIAKADCYLDSEGQCYFNVENVHDGEHFAVFVGAFADMDYTKQHRVWTDRQPLFTGGDDCDTAGKAHRCDGHEVHYEQVWTANVEDGEYLTDSDGNFVYTSDGQRISFPGRSSTDGKVRMQMTGDEFLKLIEGRDPNSEINTIPELMDAMQGISDDTTVIDEIEDIQDENEASDADIDSIFERNP